MQIYHDHADAAWDVDPVRDANDVIVKVGIINQTRLLLDDA